ncbi:lipid phosphate phosphatase delta-like [Telopea speciosissima]|uniref:lipid phosphate phosphatase delta-like n=1 Tax=Telopea speciosissima TaxID=54955 RepID=UPI001CC6ED6C|nr:lipid phosphate phosphatase delta-like [Telopea speciosissima]
MRGKERMESVALWSIALCQVLSLSALLLWNVVASYFDITHNLRSLTQQWITHRVIADTPLILQIQSFQHRFLDALFSGLSGVVSVPFYTAFLPLLFWSGHCKLARQMTLLMAFCDYLGNSVKDVVSAPRPSSPPVRRLTATKDEEENALEYGFPSSHALNTVCLAGYLLHYVLYSAENRGATHALIGVTVACLLVGLVSLGRIYLGMHSVVDVLGGLVFGLVILAFWLTVHEYMDRFIVSGHNVSPFWTAFSFLLLFAYPTPERPTPSFEYHTAFNGVILGMVIGFQQAHHHFHRKAIRHICSPQLSLPVFVGRILFGIPAIILVKFCSKALAKWILPVLANTLGIPIRSSSYIPQLNISLSGENAESQKMFFSPQDSFDVDTGIRFLQYAILAWSIVDLVPPLFSLLRL